ncbi:MAG: ATP-binding protein [Chitinophagales bacterium]|nr:ATP-binding protein [Bacteroidota bacterium]
MKLTFQVPCDVVFLQNIRDKLHHFFSQQNIPPATAYQLVLAADEACANAIVHGHTAQNSDTLHIQVNYQPPSISIEIFDVGNLPTTDIPQKFDCQKAIKKHQRGGMGLFIIQQLADSVQYFSRNNTHYCKIIKNI